MRHSTDYIIIVLAVFCATFSIAQTKSTDQLVKGFLGTTEYESSSINNPGLIKYLKVKSLQGYSVQTVPAEKIIQLEFLPPVFYSGREISISQFEADLKSPDFNF